MSCLNIWRVIMGSVKGRISARNKQYWIDKGYSEPESITLARSRSPGTIEYFNIFKKLSMDESIKLSEEWVKRRAVTLENMINRHGLELGHLKWNAYCDRQAYAGCKLEYFIEKYGEVDGLEKYTTIGLKKSHSLDSYILRYNNDIELATNEYIKYWKSQSKPNSNIANELFDVLYTKLVSLGYIKIYYSNNIGEWYIRDNSDNRIYFADFYCREIGKVIEFNGDYWHANPKKYSYDIYMNYPSSHKVLTQDIWAIDEYKINLIKNHPDIKDVLVIWESDYRENKQLIIEKCLNFLLQ